MPELHKTCVICGKEFITNIHNRTVCYDEHHHACPVCGKDVITNDPKRQNCACSRKCGSQQANISRELSVQAKYGVSNVSQRADVREQISEKLKEIHPKQPPIVRQCEVCGKSFEAKWPYTQHTCSSACRGIYRKITGISKSVYAKSCATNEAKYGAPNPGQRPEIHVKMEDTMEARYGVRYARYLPEVEAKVQATCMERYGVPYYIQTEDANRTNRERISATNKQFQQHLEQCGIVAELEKYLCGKFYDIVIESAKVLIEIDPTYTHNICGNHWNSEGIPVDYHLKKTQIAVENGYRCIHVFDWDDWDRVIDLVRQRDKVGARQCDIVKLDTKTAELFTSRYHLAGSCRGQTECYGLVNDGQLLEVMTFGKPRYNKKYDWELLRLCSLQGITVVGGASKLFSAFVTAHQSDRSQSIISYCDKSKFTGSVYQQIGMKKLSDTAPNQIWSKDNKKITQNLLNQRGFDQLFGTTFGKGTSNEELMLKHGWLPVYDCGQFVFEYVF